MADRDRGRLSSSYNPRDRGRDRDRDRDHDDRSWQMYRDSQTQRRESPTEPGQIRRPTREWEVERDPRVPPTVGSAAAAGPSRRSVSPEPDYSSKDIGQALDAFSRCMHSTLLATTTQALAARHVERLDSFPQAQVNPDTLSEARARLHDADSVLGDKMRALQSTFGDLMRQVNVPSPRPRRDSRAFEQREDLQRMIRDKVDFSELVSVRKRLEGVERQLDEGIDLKGKGKEKEPTPTPVPAEVEAKRSRARELLEDMLRRLEKVEAMKDDLENRYFDIRDQLNAKEQEELEVLRLGNGRWKIIEELRDPDGVIRGLKRRRPNREEDHEVEQVMAVDKVDPPPTAGAADVSDGAMPITTPAPAPDATAQALRLQVDSLQKELTALKDGQAAREKAIADQISATIEARLDGMVRQRIMKAIDVVKATGVSGKPGQKTATSPSLPTIPQNAVMPSPTIPSGSASRPSSSAGPSQSQSAPPPPPQAVRSVSNPQSRSANATPQIPQQPSPALATQPPPRPASHPVGDSANPSDGGQPKLKISPLPGNPYMAGWGGQPATATTTVTNSGPPQPPQSAPPTTNPLNRLIDPTLQSTQPPLGLGIRPAPSPQSQSAPTQQAQLQAFQALVNHGQNGHSHYHNTYRPPPPPAHPHSQVNQGDNSLLQKWTNSATTQQQQHQQQQNNAVDNSGFTAWSIYPPHQG